MAATHEERRAVRMVPVSSLACRPQVRESFDEESLAGLAQTMKETGILQPLLARRSGSELVVLEGHRRLLAAKMAGIAHVPVIIDDRELSEGEVVYRQLVVNCSREDLQPLEKARAVQRLIEATKWPAAQVAVKLGMSPGMVSKLLALLSLPESVQEKVASGALRLTTAYALSQATDADAQRELASEAANSGLTREAVVERVRERKTKKGRTAASKRRAEGNGRVALPIGERCHVRAPGRGLTVQAFAGALSAFLSRVSALEPKDMELADAAKALANGLAVPNERIG